MVDQIRLPMSWSRRPVGNTVISLEGGRDGSAADRDPLNYAKLISGSLLVRTDFGSLFMKLPEAERRELGLHYQAFMDWLLGIVDLGGKADDPVFERGVYKNNAPRTGKNADVTLSDAPELKITRRDWIMGIAGGVDWLSAKRFEEYKDNLEGLGGIGEIWTLSARTRRRATTRAS